MSLTGKKILVAYYSKSGVTKDVAHIIQEALNADVFEVIPKTAYPEDYTETTVQAKKEIHQGFHPELVSNGDVSGYDVVFVGSPCWWSTIAPPVATFLEKNDFNGKAIIPFITNGGSGLASCPNDIQKLAPGSKVVDSKAFGDPHWVKGYKPDAVRKWVKEISI